jgi:hypothetical protein
MVWSGNERHRPPAENLFPLLGGLILLFALPPLAGVGVDRMHGEGPAPSTPVSLTLRALVRALSPGE